MNFLSQQSFLKPENLFHSYIASSFEPEAAVEYWPGFPLLVLPWKSRIILHELLSHLSCSTCQME